MPFHRIELSQNCGDKALLPHTLLALALRCLAAHGTRKLQHGWAGAEDNKRDSISEWRPRLLRFRHSLMWTQLWGPKRCLTSIYSGARLNNNLILHMESWFLHQSWYYAATCSAFFWIKLGHQWRKLQKKIGKGGVIEEERLHLNTQDICPAGVGDTGADYR